jgi:hypothetical protein
MYRSGTTMYYKLKISVEGIGGGSYYGYNINDSLSLNGSNIHADQLKGSSPSQWSTIEHETNYVAVPNKISGTVPCSFRLYSTGGSQRDETLSFDLPIVEAVLPTPPTDINFNINPLPNDKNLIVSWDGATGGDGTIDYYNLYYKINNGDYIQIGGNITNSQYEHNTSSLDLKDGDILTYKIYTHSTTGMSTSFYEESINIIASTSSYVKINSNWKKAMPYIKINNVWKKAIMWMKINGIWKKGK